MNTLTIPVEVNHDLSLSDQPPKPLLGYGAALIGEEERLLLEEVVAMRQPFRYYGATRDANPPMAATLEKELCSITGTGFALAVTSGTAALETALGALGVGPDDEVILPAWSWISCFTSIVRLGAKPVLAEINETFCLEPSEIRRLVTSKTKAVLVVHYQGVAAEMDEILAEAGRYGIAVLEDCAESFGTHYKGHPVGSLGDIAIFSFQYNKILSSGEGGAVVTSNPELYERAVRMHDLGQYRRHHEEIHAASEAPFCGGQYRMNEFTAAVALAQLRKLPGIIQQCRNLSAPIRRAAAALPGVTLRRTPDPSGEVPIETYFWLEEKGAATRMRSFLDSRNVHCQQVTGTYCQYRRRYCLERSTSFGQIPQFSGIVEWPAIGYRPQDFPMTERLVADFVAIPVSCYFTPQDADHVAASLNEARCAIL